MNCLQSRLAGNKEFLSEKLSVYVACIFLFMSACLRYIGGGKEKDNLS